MAQANKKLTPAGKRALAALQEPVRGFYGKILKWENIIREGVTLEAREFKRLRRIGLEGQFHFLWVWHDYVDVDEENGTLLVRYRRTPRSRWQTIGLLAEMMDYTCFARAGYPTEPIMVEMHDLLDAYDENGYGWDVPGLLFRCGWGPENCIPVE